MRTALVALMLIALAPPVAAQAPKVKDGKRAKTATVQRVPSKQLMQQIADAWCTLDMFKPAPYYDKNPTDLFFDFSPLKYTGWQQYADGVKAFVANVQSAKVTLGDDTQVQRSGNMAIGATTLRLDMNNKDGTKQTLVGRWTAVWEKKGDKWLIVHDHWSAPLPETEKK